MPGCTSLCFIGIVCYDVIMELDNFMPYQLVLLAESVSQSLAAVYRDRFSLNRDEWRILAALAGQEQAKTTTIIERTALDKMRVSRAVASMLEAGLLQKAPDPEDRRNTVLQLLPAGKALYAKKEVKVTLGGCGG